MNIRKLKIICRVAAGRIKYADIVLLLATIFFMVGPAFGDDMRAASRKARADYEAAQAASRESRARIFNDRKALEKEVGLIQTRVAQLNADIKAKEDALKLLEEKSAALTQDLSNNEMGMQELSGIMRGVARDAQTLLGQSQFTAFWPKRLDRLKPMMDKEHFPGIDDTKVLADIFFHEMALSGEVSLQKGHFIGRSGQKEEGDILTIGKFTAAYQTERETGFLRCSEDTHQFFALSALPSWLVKHNLDHYMQGKTEAACLDVSGGAALKQITHKTTLTEQVKNGGLIVWPILGIGLLALFMTLERVFFLKGVHDNTDRVMGEVNELARQKKWRECDDIIKRRKDRPVYNVLRAGLNARGEKRDILESILQEAILKELPRLERFLPMLNIMGAVAPLLGLLGTVTGMIGTFRVITLYGTGDPRVMSGGISEALVTTMFGLAVAIPIMLIHTFLNRRIEHVVGDMEEKAVALTNIIHRESLPAK